MSAFEPDLFLDPLSAAAPSGDDLEYDLVFRELLEAGEYKPETEYGGRVYEAREPLWPIVRDRSVALARRSHDLRIAVWIARSGARIDGLAAYLAGLRLIDGLLSRHWASVHPMLDATDHDDPTARLNALAPLSAPREGLADLRSIVLTSQRGTLTVRDVELAFRAADPVAGEAVPTQNGVGQAIAAEEGRSPGLVAALSEAPRLLAAIVETLGSHLAGSALPDFEPLEKILAALARAASAAGGDLSTEPTHAVVDAVDGPSQPASAKVAGGIANREDAVRLLEQVCSWLERNDPSNPAPLLIRRAQRLMQKNFLDIIRDLAPDTLDQIEKLAGIERS